MADFSAIKTEIQTNIDTNGNQEITGAVLQNTLIDMVDATEDEIKEISHDIFVNATQYFNTIAELYITAPIVSDSEVIVKCNNSELYVRCGIENIEIDSSSWQVRNPITGKENNKIYELSCTTASATLGVEVGDIVGYIIFKDIDTLISMTDPSTGKQVYLDKCKDINFNPIISSSLFHRDRSINPIALQNFGKVPRILTSNINDMNLVVDEIYILPEYCDDSLLYTIRPYNSGFIFGAYHTIQFGRLWGIRLYHLEETSYQNGNLIPLVVDITTSAVAVGTLVGYIILKDIETLIQMPIDPSIGETINIGLASQLFLNSKIATLLNETYASPLIKGVDITLPDEIIAVEGDTLQIFWRSIIGAFNPYIFDVVAVCFVGKSYPRYFTFTPTTSDVGNTYTLQVLVKGNDGSVIVEKSCTIRVIAKMTSPVATKNILCIGASATAGGHWVGELDRRLTATSGNGTPENPTGLGLTNIAFVGRKTGYDVPVHLEATGGWRVQDYASPGSIAVRFYVTGVNTISLGAKYSHNGVIYVVQEVNVTDGVGNIRCTLENTFVTPSEPYILTKVSGSGDDEITFTSYEEENFSPFWNESTDELDFVTYANTYCDGHIDCLIWHCGVNDLTSGNPSVIPTVISSFRELLDAYHQQFPNGKVIISSVPLGSVNGGFTANYGSSATLNYFKFAKVVQKYAQALDDLCNEAAYSSFVEYAPVLEEFDAENSYPTSQTPVNNRSSVTEALGTSGVHPLATGYYMTADAVYRTFNNLGY